MTVHLTLKGGAFLLPTLSVPLVLFCFNLAASGTITGSSQVVILSSVLGKSSQQYSGTIQGSQDLLHAKTVLCPLGYLSSSSGPWF